MTNTKNKIRSMIVGFGVLFVALAGHYVYANVITAGYAWNSNIGWVNFAGVDYDKDTRIFTGAASYHDSKWVAGILSDGEIDFTTQNGTQLALSLDENLNADGNFAIHGQAFSNQIGWVFADHGGADPAALKPNGELTGNFWSNEFGWIQASASDIGTGNVQVWDLADIIISETTLTIGENGGAGSFDVKLAAQPTTDVVINFISESVIDATLSSAILTFTNINWDTTQTVTVTGVDDNIIGNDSVDITISVDDGASDNSYDTIADKIVSVTLIDDESSTVDTDGDGVPNDQEITDGTNPNDAIDFKDTDGDGVPDYVENQEGTDINDPDDFKDTDGDGVGNYTEDHGANGGDGDGDGMLDSQQREVSGAFNSVTGEYTTLKSAGVNCTFITENAFIAESSLTQQDNLASYPVGLVDFQVQCTNPGESADIILYYAQQYDTSSWIYKKYDSTGKVYSDISTEITFGTASVGGTSVTTVSFTVTDGDSQTDEDGVADTFINDPSGSAIPVVDSSTELPIEEESDISICADGTRGDVKGYIWYDQDDDGNFDKDESGIEDVDIELKDVNNNVIAQDETNEDGQYKFKHIDAGKYMIDVDLGDNEIEGALQTYEKGNNRNGKVQFTHVCGKDYKKADFGFVYEKDIQNDKEETLSVASEIVALDNRDVIINMESDIIEIPETGTITLKNLDGDKLGLRLGPGTSYDLITRIGEDVKLILISVSDNGKWYHVKTNQGVEGWISTDYAQKNEILKEERNISTRKEEKVSGENKVVNQIVNADEKVCTAWPWFVWISITIVLIVIIFLMSSPPVTVIVTVLGLITWVIFDACRTHWWMPAMLIIGVIVTWYLTQREEKGE